MFVNKLYDESVFLSKVKKIKVVDIEKCIWIISENISRNGTYFELSYDYYFAP